MRISLGFSRASSLPNTLEHARLYDEDAILTPTLGILAKRARQNAPLRDRGGAPGGNV
jgi:hypothetical protein